MRFLTGILVAAAVLALTGCGSERRVAMDREFPGLVIEDDFVTDFQLRSGARWMNDSAWEGLDEQFTVGLAWTARKEAWPVSFAGSIDVHTLPG